MRQKAETPVDCLQPAVVGMQLLEERELVQADGKGGDESVLTVQDFEVCENCHATYMYRYVTYVDAPLSRVRWS